MLRHACLFLFVALSLAQDHAGKAVQLVQQGDLRAAERELRLALETAPNDSALLTSLGGILGMQGQLQQANVYLAKAVKLNPQDAAARRNLAANQWQLGQLEDAHANLDVLIRANPHDPIATYLLGMVSERQADYARSIALLESTPDITARQPEAIVALASSYYHTGRPAEAAARLKSLLGRPAKPKVFFMAGRVAADANDNILAEQLLSAATATSFPAAHQAFAARGAVQMKLSYFSQAAESFRKAQRLHPAADNQRNLALAEWRAGQKQPAAADFERALREYPRDAPTCVVYGTLLLEEASPESRTRAVALFKQALSADDSSVEARYQLANLELEEGNLQPALQHLTAAIKLEPDASRLHFALSRVYRRLGREADAAAEMAAYQRLKSTERRP
jgi:tetratricopeptide (TPR) repeat protein